MVSLTALWLPILLSAVLVFVVSSVIHMVLPWHKSDYAKLANEDQVRNALRPLNVPPGTYFVPRPSGQEEMRSPAFAEKVKQGPVLMMTVLPSGELGMGKQLIQWFGYSVVVGALAGLVAGSVLAPGAEYKRVFHVVALTAFCAYAVALWQMAIWYGRSWVITTKATIDGLAYALVTAGVFGWLWP
jgi:hypothetical protein